MREMVEVILYDDGTYEVNGVDSRHVTQKMVGWSGSRHLEKYYCKKDKWKYYLMKLLDTKDIDRQIQRLKKKKKEMEKLKEKISKEIKESEENDD